MEHIHLSGADEVTRAAHQMSRAAQEMGQAAATIEAALQAHRAHMDEWLERFEAALERQL